MVTKLFKGIDGRKIDCACGHENCVSGLSFDIQGNYGILRMHYPNIERDINGKIIKIEQNETPMRIEVKQIDEIIENLKEIKKELKIQITMTETLKILSKTFAKKLDKRLMQIPYEQYSDKLVELATFCEISPHQLYNWRKGRTYLRLSDREMINKFFNEKIF